MGGCAGKLNIIPRESLPSEDPAPHKKAEGENAAQDSKDGGEIQSEEKAMLIENGKEGQTEDCEVKNAAPAAVEAGEEPTKKPEDVVEGPVGESKDQVEAGGETQLPAKKGQAEDKADGAPISEDKNGAVVATA